MQRKTQQTVNPGGDSNQARLKTRKGGKKVFQGKS